MSRLLTAFTSAIATVTGNTFLLLGTVVFSTLAVVTAWVPPVGRSVVFCARIWAWLWLACAGMRVKAHFADALDPAKSYIFLANHCSWIDIPLLFRVLPGRPRFMAKRSLFQIPVFGWALHLGGFIPVDRGNRERSRDAFGQAIETLQAARPGDSVVIFPEGTRSPDGRLHELRRGGLLMALKSGLPVVPVGIRGSFEAYPRGTLRVRPGRLEVHSGTPLRPEDYGVRGRKRFEADLRLAILELSDQQSAS